MFKHKGKGKNKTREPQINVDAVNTSTTNDIAPNEVVSPIIYEATDDVAQILADTIPQMESQLVDTAPITDNVTQAPEEVAVINEDVSSPIEVVEDISALDTLNEETMLATPVAEETQPVVNNTAIENEVPSIVSAEANEISSEEQVTIYSSLDDVDPDMLTDLQSGEVASRKTEKKDDEKAVVPNPVEPIKLNIEADKNATPAKKSKAKTFMHVLIAVLIVIAIVGFFAFSKSGLKNKFQSPLSINNHAVDSDEFSFMYHYILIENGVDVFAQDAQEMLNSASEDPNYATNRDYFLDITAQQLQTTQLLYDDATKNGLNIEDKHYSMATAYVDWLSTKADELNISLDTYIRGIFGTQVDENCVINTLAKKYFAEDYASDAKLVELQATSEQANEAYKGNQNIYDLISYKILRITYEQREEAFISTAMLHANQIIEAMGNDPSKFESSAAEYFSGKAQEQLMQPDSTLIKDVRFADVTHDEFRTWLFDLERNPGDSIIFADEDGFPIILCFVKRTPQSTPLRNVKIIEVSAVPADENGESSFSLGDAQNLSQSIYDYIENETKLQSVENYFTDEVLSDTIHITSSVDTYPGKFADTLNDWIFDESRKAGDKEILEGENGFYVIYFISESENPEWYDRVNSFIRMNNYQAFLNEMTTEYSYEFNQSGLEQIYDVP